MKNFISFLGTIIRLLLSLRYSVKLEGFEDICRKTKGKGVLFLPNHPAEVEPIIVLANLWNKFKPRPLAVEYFYKLKGVHFFMEMCKAVSIPDMNTAVNKWKKKRLDNSIDEIVKGLKKGDSFIVYPAGKLRIAAKEVVGGASLVYNVLQKVSGCEVVLVRTEGLWGSRFSRALTGRVPDFFKELIKGSFIILKNFIFFTPRRQVKVTFKRVTEDIAKFKDKIDLNHYLEDFYNAPPYEEGEPLKLVSYSFWKNDLPEVSQGIYKKKKLEGFKIPDDIRSKVYSHIAKLSKVSVQDLTDSTHLASDLGLDSLDIAEISLFLHSEFDVIGLTPGSLQTIEDVLEAACGINEKQERIEREGELRYFAWPKEKNRKEPLIIESETMLEAFLRSCDRMRGASACVDNTSGLMSYKKLKLAALVLAKKIQQSPGQYIGIMLPSTVAAYLSILACWLAGKTPVMLNWTAGPRSLDFALSVTNMGIVLTSEKFLDRLEVDELGKIEDKLVTLEKLKENISFKDKLSRLLLVFFKTNLLLRFLRLHRLNSEDTSVILFTSGTEALPKAVPLTHKNILFDQIAGLECVDLKSSDIFYGVLPPFHSFGFSLTGLLPLLAGIRVAYSPDPTDSYRLAEDIRNWEITIFCSAPSFTKALFSIAKKKDLKSVRLFVVGAEKAPKEIFDFVDSLGTNAQMIEGYGITECSPAVSLNRPWLPKKGVGKPLPGVSVCVIDEESEKILKHGEEGEICIKGPNVFSGYLGSNKNPFIEISEEKWYRSGDRGFVDNEGNIHLSGRLKRFIKIGGEMVSLEAIENDLLLAADKNNWYQKGEGSGLAVIAKRQDTEKPQILVFTTFDIDKNTLNEVLKTSGHGRIVKVNEVIVIDKIPIMGTGKTNYRLLEERGGA